MWSWLERVFGRSPPDTPTMTPERQAEHELKQEHLQRRDPEHDDDEPKPKPWDVGGP
jgi:hypothetical protein